MTVNMGIIENSRSNFKRIEALHATRITKFARIHFDGREEQAVRWLIVLHRDKVNIASYISQAIDESHEEYQRKLKELGECDEFIR